MDRKGFCEWSSMTLHRAALCVRCVRYLGRRGMWEPGALAAPAQSTWLMRTNVLRRVRAERDQARPMVRPGGLPGGRRLCLGLGETRQGREHLAMAAAGRPPVGRLLWPKAGLRLVLFTV
jgi:hypothetical protein